MEGERVMSHAQDYFGEVSSIALSIDHSILDRIVGGLVELRSKGGRLFIIGVGGSGANASHAVGDFRKMTQIEAYSPIDNTAELTARTNDEGWSTVFQSWLRVSNANKNDAIFVLSVGGGDLERNVSANIVKALDEAKKRNLRIYGIVGRDGGYTARVGDDGIVIPTVNPAHITALSESFQSVILHGITCHPELMNESNRWETIDSVELVPNIE